MWRQLQGSRHFKVVTVVILLNGTKRLLRSLQHKLRCSQHIVYGGCRPARQLQMVSTHTPRYSDEISLASWRINVSGSCNQDESDQELAQLAPLRDDATPSATTNQRRNPTDAAGANRSPVRVSTYPTTLPSCSLKAGRKDVVGPT